MKLLRRTSMRLFLFFFAIYLASGLYLAYFLNIYHNDAVARTALAFFTIFGRDPHLGAIGFVWQPLPSLLQIPLLLVLRPLGLQMLAGPIVTSVFGAIGVVALYKISNLLGRMRREVSLLAIVLYGLNPLILLYAAIGSSETILITSLLVSTYYFVKWFVTSNFSSLILSSVFMVLAFGSRYESVIAFASTLLLIALIALFRKSKSAKIESQVFLYALPFAYVVLLWIGINWIIMGNPFYFLNSEYSNASFTENIKANPSLMEYSYHSLFGSFTYAARRIALLAPILFLLPAFLFQFLNLRKIQRNIGVLASLLTPYMSILLFHVYQLYKGDSLGWLRFFIYALCSGVLLSLFFIKRQTYLYVACILLMIFGIFSSVYAMSNKAFGKEENSFVSKILDTNATLDYSRTYSDQKLVSDYMDSVEGKILIDTNEGFAIPLFSRNPERYVITSDVDYLKVVKSFDKYVDWVIIPSPSEDVLRKNIIYRQYPEIAYEGLANLKLEETIDGWMVFKVTKNSKDRFLVNHPIN